MDDHPKELRTSSASANLRADSDPSCGEVTNFKLVRSESLLRVPDS